MVIYYILSLLIILLTLLPHFKNQHWVFRIGDFAKVHIIILSIINVSIGLLFTNEYITGLQILQSLIILYHCTTVFRYTPLYYLPKKEKSPNSSRNISILSANVYQPNKDFKRFHDLIIKYKPDLFITLESNSDWETANRAIEYKYPFFHKVTLENTYGMHLYSTLKIKEAKEHYFVANDIPCIEAHIKLHDGYQFVVFAVHPPPPSPVEEENSKERDGELMSLSKRILEINLPVVVIGDLNNVAWSRSSILFRKKGNLIDPRIGRGLISTFHAKYFFLRIPIDHIFHTSQIFVDEIRALEYFGSDHFPIWAKFWIDHKNDIQEEEIIETTPQEELEIERLIKEGLAQEGNREENIKIK